MARLHALKPQEMSAEAKEMLGEKALAEPEKLGVARIWAQRPDLLAAHLRMKADLRSNSVLPPRLIELVRIRVAFHNQCRSCMAIRYSDGVEDGVSPDLVCELATPEDAPNLTERERSALRYADLLAANHLAISDATFDDLRKHFSEPEIVELCCHVGYFVGFGRIAMSWDMVDDLPQPFHDRDSAITPWGVEEDLVAVVTR